MIESLRELYQSSQKKLLFFHGDTLKVIKNTVNKLNIDSVYVNNDYTPFSIERDKDIKDMLDCDFYGFDDIVLNSMSEPKKADSKPYQVYSSYLKAIFDKPPKKPLATSVKKKLKQFDGKLEYQIDVDDLKKFYEHNKDINVNGGRTKAKNILNNILDQKNYNELRSLCDYKSTHLSAYIKFGCVSIREVYWIFRNNLGLENGLVKQLYWREFYYYLLFYFPETLTKKTGLKKTYENFPWEKDQTKFDKWCMGETGFPIVDASMKNLNKTGYLPNRSRLIVANFLTKILRIDWTWGEKYFAQQLVDYSPSNNLGNWQWVASIGSDYQNRIYNPMTQSSKADPDCVYIKKWLPVLKDVKNKDIHNWPKNYEKYDINYSRS